MQREEHVVGRLVFIDMDDTFLSPDKTIPADNLAVLDEAYERGVEIVPCTGRTFMGIPRELVEHPSVRYAVCCNGSLAYDAKTGETLHEVDIEKDVVRGLYDELKNLNITFDVCSGGVVYTAADRWHLMDELGFAPKGLAQVKGMRKRFDGTVDQAIEAVGEICRVNVFFLTEKDAHIVWAAVDARPELTRASSLPCNVEITRAGTNKGSGVRWICEYLGVDPADAIAFGDSMNDLSMLEAVGDGVAMANALDACKAVANHIAPPCSESGVAQYLRALWDA